MKTYGSIFMMGLVLGAATTIGMRVTDKFMNRIKITVAK